KALARGSDGAPFQVLAGGEGDGVDHGVEAAKPLTDLPVDLGQLRFVGDVAGDDQRIVQGGGEVAHVAFHALALVGDGQARSLALHGLRNAPGDAAVVGDAVNYGGLAL